MPDRMAVAQTRILKGFSRIQLRHRIRSTKAMRAKTLLSLGLTFEAGV